MALSAKRRAFIEQYLRDFNGTQAAIRAGYSERSARVSACKILARPEVQAEIQRRLAELKMGTDEVLLRLTEQARAEYAEYLGDDGTVDLQRMLDDGKAHLVRGTKWDRRGNLVVEFYDAQAALVQIGRAPGSSLVWGCHATQTAAALRGARMLGRRRGRQLLSGALGDGQAGVSRQAAKRIEARVRPQVAADPGAVHQGASVLRRLWGPDRGAAPHRADLRGGNAPLG